MAAAAVNAERISSRMQMYREGLSDNEIAEREGGKRNTISQWRKSRGLRLNADPTLRSLSIEQSATRRLMYDLGLSDAQIAREQKVDRKAVAEWRERKQLPQRYGHSSRGAKNVPDIFRSLVRTIRRSVGASLAPDIVDEICSEITLGVLEGRLDPHQIRAEARKFGNRVLGEYASKFGPRSIDEVIPGTEDMRLVDVIPDHTASGWLEEMGATVY